MKPGDLVIPWQTCAIHKSKEPTFSSPGSHRLWSPAQPTLIVAEWTRNVRGKDVLKFQILLDGELWWTGAGTVRLLGDQ